jgi:hypothetical protein
MGAETEGPICSIVSSTLAQLTAGHDAGFLWRLIKDVGSCLGEYSIKPKVKRTYQAYSTTTCISAVLFADSDTRIKLRAIGILNSNFDHPARRKRKSQSQDKRPNALKTNSKRISMLLALPPRSKNQQKLLRKKKKAHFE